MFSSRIIRKSSKINSILIQCYQQQQQKQLSSATFTVHPYKLHRMDEGPSTEVTCTREQALKYYREMTTIRRLEAAANALYKEKAVRGFCHLYTGQEAVAVGMENSITKKDAVITAYRAHGWTWLRGVSLVGVLAELTGRETGCARGKGGSMHLYCDRFYGGNGIVGAQIPLGAGLSLAQKYTNSGEVTLALCGDGAANQGQVFEAFNMSALWKLPVIFIVENNGYGMGTSADRASACPLFYTRGDYIPGIWVDGMDVLAVRQCTEYLVKLCREGQGPFVMEAATYRYFGHSVSDPGTSYRTRDEVQEVRRSRDPITMFKENILQAELVNSDELKEIDIDIRKQVDQAAEKSRLDPELSTEHLYNDVYVNMINNNNDNDISNDNGGIRSTTPFHRFKHQNTTKPCNI